MLERLVVVKSGGNIDPPALATVQTMEASSNFLWKQKRMRESLYGGRLDHFVEGATRHGQDGFFTVCFADALPSHLPDIRVESKVRRSSGLKYSVYTVAIRLATAAVISWLIALAI